MSKVAKEVVMWMASRESQAEERATTTSQRMLLVQLFNRYLYNISEPHMTLKRNVQRLSTLQKDQDTTSSSSEQGLMTILGKIRNAHFVSLHHKVKMAHASWEEMLKREDHTWVLCYQVAIARIHRAMSKSVSPLTRQNGIIQAVGLLRKYQTLRIEDVAQMSPEIRSNVYHEVWYNMGRVFHYLDVMYLALDCYCRALSNEGRDFVDAGTTLERISMEAREESSSSGGGSGGGGGGGGGGDAAILRLVAHNLVVCLRTSPGMEMYARDVVRRYLTF
jgi:hypothetical protein